MTNDELTFKEPYKRQSLKLKTLPASQLEVVGHQRKARPAHVEHLVSSIERIGFIVPLVAVQVKKDGKDRYVVIDGQHRLQAAQELGIRKLPVLVVPERLAPRMMNLNVEKDLNIREKAVVALGIYRTLLETNPEVKETDSELEVSIERAYYVTLGLAYEKSGRTTGSAFEPLLKKSDFFLKRAMEKAYVVRDERAATVVEANSLVRDVTAKAKEMGVWHQYFPYQLISSIDPFRRKRGRQNFNELFGKAIAKLKKMNEDPTRIRKLAR
ncbi:MAG: ParB/RepB/Spo0J family partition protein [Actinomycetota bacterium]